MKDEPTLHDVLEAISDFSSRVDERFESMHCEMTGEINGLKADISSMRSQMVTKDYLDRKIENLWGDTIGLVRKEDTKVNLLTKNLNEAGSLSKKKTAEVMSSGPFPSKVSR